MKCSSRRFVAWAMAASIFMGSSVMTPRRSEAGIGLLVAALGGNPIAAGAFVLASVGAGAGAVHFFSKGWNNKGGKALVSYLISAAAALGAIYLLDSPSVESGEFKSLSEEDAQSAGLTQQERNSYEKDLPLLNSLREEVILLANREFKDSKAASVRDLERISGFIRVQWQELAGDSLAPETAAAIRKLGSRLSSDAKN